MMNSLPVILGVVGLFVALLIYRMILKYPAGEGKVAEIGDQIHRGAMVFMRREYTYLLIFVAVVSVLIFISDLGANTTFAFLLGAACSGVAGYIGMFAATHANVRTTTAAAQSGAEGALAVSLIQAGRVVACIGDKLTPLWQVTNEAPGQVWDFA